MSEQTPAQSVEPSVAAFSRLEEFPSDPVQVAVDSTKEERMREMEAWSNAIGAHTERLAERHSDVGRQIIESALGSESIDVQTAAKQLADAPKTFRTGVRVDPNLAVEVHDAYPYFGDTPRGGRQTYRAPKDIPRS